MKKLLLLFVVFTVAITTVNSQVPRDIVLIEIGTGTGCPYCPGAAMALHDLYTNGDPVAGIEYHSFNSSDPFNTPEAAARTSYYGITGYPTAQFDGEYDEYVGGSSSSSLYSSYLPIVNARMGDLTDFTVEIYGDNTGNLYDITVRVTHVGAYSGSNLHVRFALTETDIPYSWQGQSMVEYCERLMAPDENGTPISFASGNTQDVSLNFTFDNTWVMANCELIAWIQDDDNKYVLHSASVMLPDLEPDVANAAFTVSNTAPCEGTSVQYTDQSSGSITTWNWTFEGGTPATSTDQNPVVTYATQGVYDVTLYVSDGTTNSTLTNDDMIDVMVPPVQPNTPTGETDVCANTTHIYTVDPVPNADTYIWEVSPADAGTISGSGTEGTFEAAGDYTGSYNVTVRADNYCGNGIWSTALACNLNMTPVAFLLSDGGSMCEGSAGIEITQDGSEAGIDYELFKDDVSTGIIIAGTGNPISYGVQNDEGTYTAFGMAPLCDLQMWGTPWLYFLDDPVQPDPPAGETDVCNGETSNYSVSIYDYADTIYWDLQPIEAGTVIGGDFEADIEWSPDFSGLATLTAQGANQCGTGPVSDATEINVESTPAPEISGLTLVCDNEAAEYSVTEVTGNTYQWTVDGGTITTGAGTSMITVMWGDPGMGSVSVMESTTADCSGSTENYEVTIDDCIGIDETLAFGEVVIFPNPASTNVEIVFNGKESSKYNVVVYNTMGQKMNESTGYSTVGNQSVSVDVSTYPQGLYIVNITSENGLNIKTTFEKTN